MRKNQAKAKSELGNTPQFTKNALEVLKRRYLLKDERYKVIEPPSKLFWRVAQSICKAELFYGQKIDLEDLSNQYYHIMSSLEFLPNSPTLMNAGTRLGQLSACFVLPVDDSIRNIFGPVMYLGLIQQSGGGTGFSFSKLRPKGDIVKTTMGEASGPVSFMRVFDVATEVVKQGGKRRGANMGILHVSHPDIFEFIKAKLMKGSLSNFNISVAVTDAFMDAVEKDGMFELINPRTKNVVKELKAREIWNQLVFSAWKTGDPGIVFMDEINRHNPTPQMGQIESTNPCGEQPLLPFESCNLGSINVSKFVKDKIIEWDRLKKLVRLAVRFLDDVIDVNHYPIPKIEKVTKANRKIGLGVMGFADMLIKLGIPYDSDEAIDFGGKLMKFISEEARGTSEEIARQKGSFPNFKESTWKKKGFKCMRNATITTIAPTGTISIIAGCSSGIEPLFAIAYVRNILDGTRLPEIHPLFEKVAKERGFYAKNLIKRIAQSGSIQKITEIPEDVRRIFVTAHDIAPEWHVKMQAAFQKHCDNAVSKTVNLPYDATPEDVEKIFKLAYKLKCKGITVYRYGSKEQQVLQFGPNVIQKKYVSAGPEYAGGCPTSECPA